LAADAFNSRACRKIFKAKGRPITDPLIVHIASLEGLPEVAIANPAALVLAKEFWPGPLTMVLPKAQGLPNIVSASLPSVAVRMPAHPLFRRLIALAGRPLAAPSANPFGYISPTTAAHVHAGLGSKIKYILDGGSSGIGLESTIIDLRVPRRPRILRPGAITREQLSAALGRHVTKARARSTNSSVEQVAPGAFSRHYSPTTPVKLHKILSMGDVARGTLADAWLFITRPTGKLPENVFCLSQTGNLKTAARNLFSCLRQLDNQGFYRIHVERARGNGTAMAINDRLTRASAR
jgi:L-threonylcarbamoyladenylate synthase